MTQCQMRVRSRILNSHQTLCDSDRGFGFLAANSFYQFFHVADYQGCQIVFTQPCGWLGPAGQRFFQPARRAGQPPPPRPATVFGLGTGRRRKKTAKLWTKAVTPRTNTTFRCTICSWVILGMGPQSSAAKNAKPKQKNQPEIQGPTRKNYLLQPLRQNLCPHPVMDFPRFCVGRSFDMKSGRGPRARGRCPRARDRGPGVRGPEPGPEAGARGPGSPGPRAGPGDRDSPP